MALFPLLLCVFWIAEPWPGIILPSLAALTGLRSKAVGLASCRRAQHCVGGLFRVALPPSGFAMGQPIGGAEFGFSSSRLWGQREPPEHKVGPPGSHRRGPCKLCPH